MPELTRHVLGRRDARLHRLGRVVRRELVRPRIDDGGVLACDGVDAAALGAELHRLGHSMVAAYDGDALPVAAPLERDAHAAATLVGYVAAAPLWSAALAALAEVDATFVVLGCDDFASWEQAVASPLEAWSVRGDARPETPSLRELVHALIAAHHGALRAQLAWNAGAGVRQPLMELWEQALALALHAPAMSAAPALATLGEPEGGGDATAVPLAFAALRALRDALSDRREALFALGGALDDAAGTTPRHRVAMMLACRPLWALALLRAVDDWLTGLTVARRGHPSCERVRIEAARVAAVRAGTERNFARVEAAVRAMIGMEP